MAEVALNFDQIYSQRVAKGRFDLTGKTFGQLTVLSESGRKWGQRTWLCKCTCGADLVIPSNNLTRTNGTKSCGCTTHSRIGVANTKHGDSRSLLYKIWGGIKTRCLDPEARDYKNYGGRGVKISQEWCDSFLAFKRDMGDRPGRGYEIDRRDTNGNYCKENCRWVLQKINSQNKRTSRIWCVDGVEYESASDAGVALNISASTVMKRAKRGVAGYSSRARYENG